MQTYLWSDSLSGQNSLTNLFVFHLKTLNNLKKKLMQTHIRPKTDCVCVCERVCAWVFFSVYTLPKSDYVHIDNS